MTDCTFASSYTDDNNLLGLEEWQGALIVVVAALLALGFCIALGLVNVITIRLEILKGK